MLDKTTLIAASVPVLVFVGIIVFLVLEWRKSRKWM
jgi:hypothetical protein